MTRSAQRLHVAQPALSRTVHHLEEELGCRLFERAGRSMVLTQEGKIAQRRLQRASAELDVLREDLEGLRENRAHTVRVQMGAASYLVVEAISSWMGEHPDRRIRLVQNEGGEGTADVSVDCPINPDQTAEPHQSLFHEEVLIAVPQHALAAQEAVPLSDLRDASFISLAGSRTFRQVCDALCARHGFRPAVSLESDNPAVVRKMIALGLGIGFWPAWSWGPLKGEGVELRHLAAPDFQRTIVVSCCSDEGASFYAHLCDFFAVRQKEADGL